MRLRALELKIAKLKIEYAEESRGYQATISDLEGQLAQARSTGTEADSARQQMSEELEAQAEAYKSQLDQL